MGIEWEVDGLRAKSQSEYEAFLRDKKIIDSIKKNIDINSPAGITKLYSSLCTGNIRFESRLGFDFEDEITEKYERIALKKSKTAKKKTSFERNNKQIEEEVEISEDSVDKELVEYYSELLRKRKIYLKYGIIVVCLFVCFFATAYTIRFINSNKASDSTVKEIIQSSRDNAFVFTTIQPVHDEITYDSFEEPEILGKYIEAKETNEDFVGWIKIDDTNIDYPVVQCDNNAYYLTHGFNGKADANGCIFVDMYCSVYPRSKNLILYGHHMKSGRMFANIEKYDNEDFYKSHKIFRFDTYYEEAEYEVAFVFRDYVHASDDTDFKYYEFTDVNSETEFNSYISELTEKSIYKTNVDVTFDDELLTLSTCDYAQANGRFVVIAKKIK